MKAKILSLILTIISAGVAYGQLPADSVLRRYAAQMLMVGFKGDSINDQSDAARYVRDLKVGANSKGVILALKTFYFFIHTFFLPLL